ncbi:hypothetical protein BDZ91DRAFT_715956 [Kalaharituber pfeilii]|nr:hypothetical protein BDZ91DRAFT_715956 [Kalaharituber pfeilii]
MYLQVLYDFGTTLPASAPPWRVFVARQQTLLLWNSLLVQPGISPPAIFINLVLSKPPYTCKFKSPCTR